MHEWEGRAFAEIADLCTQRDPKLYPFGCLTGRAGEPDVLQWFRSVAEMEAFLWRMEPQRWGLRMGELAAFKTRTESVLVGLDVEGTSDSLREAHNALSRPYFEIRWWGNHWEWAQDRSAGPEDQPGSAANRHHR